VCRLSRSSSGIGLFQYGTMKLPNKRFLCGTQEGWNKQGITRFQFS
jgi:hypothetical protein